MTTFTKEKTTTRLQQDTNARAYLLNLASGYQAPESGDCGYWQPVIALANDTWNSGSNGNRGFLVSSLLNNLMADKTRYPGLAELLSNDPIPKASQPASSIENSLSYPKLPDTAYLPPKLATGACNWLDSYINYSKLVSPEGYEDFHEACGLWLLSTVAARRIRIPFTRRQYTPLMIVLVARGGLYIKSDTAEIAVDTLQAAGLRWLLGSDETTPQKLMTDMAGQLPKKYGDLDADHQFLTQRDLAMSAQRGWYYDEFGSLVSAMSKEGGVMQDFKGLLLKLDKCSDQYSYSTQARNKEIIDKPYLALLGCMTPPDIKNSAKSGSAFWGNGLWDRFAFVCPPKHSSLDIPFKIGEIPVPYLLSRTLRDWHTHLGTPTIDMKEHRDDKGRVTEYTYERGELPEVKVEFGEGTWEAWARYRSALKKIAADMPMQDLDGSYQRLSIKAIRVAALLASLENNNLIELRHWAKAQEIAERWRKSLHELYSQVNSSEEAPTYAKKVEDEITRVIRHLAEKGEKPPTIRDLSRYLTRIDIGRIKSTVMDMTRNKLLVENREGKSPRYSLIEEE